jgi:hypothetical protein
LGHHHEHLHFEVLFGELYDLPRLVYELQLIECCGYFDLFDGVGFGNNYD